jgi:hypothetical protein
LETSHSDGEHKLGAEVAFRRCFSVAIFAKQRESVGPQKHDYAFLAREDLAATVTLESATSLGVSPPRRLDEFVYERQPDFLHLLKI